MTEGSNFPGGLTVVASLKIQPDKLDEFRLAVGQAAVETRNETGCLLYEAHIDSREPETVVIVERWADAAAIEAHMALPHAREFMALLPGLLAAPPEIRRLVPLKF